MTKTKWEVSDLTDAEGPWDIEFKGRGEWHHFTVLVTEDRVVFGGACNAGFLESGYMERAELRSVHAWKQELLEQLRNYYNQGPEAAPKLICNERM